MQPREHTTAPPHRNAGTSPTRPPLQSLTQTTLPTYLLLTKKVYASTAVARVYTHCELWYERRLIISSPSSSLIAARASEPPIFSLSTRADGVMSFI